MPYTSEIQILYNVFFSALLLAWISKIIVKILNKFISLGNDIINNKHAKKLADNSITKEVNKL